MATSLRVREGRPLEFWGENSFKNGVLSVTLPETRKAIEQSRKISVTSS